jgi:hypothetical protein
VSVASSDDVSAGARFVRVSQDGFVGIEVQVAFDRKSEFAAHGAKLREADIAELLGPSMALALRARLRRFKTALPF